MYSKTLFIMSIMLFFSLVCSCSENQTNQVLSKKEQSRLNFQGYKHYKAGEYLTAAAYYEKAIKGGRTDPNTAYNAACSFAMAGNTKKAIQYLNLAADFGFRDLDQLREDSDFQEIKFSPDWAGVVKKVEANDIKFFSTKSKEAYLIFKADQDDRSRAHTWYTEENVKLMKARDQKRREEMKKLIDAGKLKVCADYVWASTIFEHGEDSSDFRLAYELSKKAVELDSTKKDLRRGMANSLDMYLLSIGKDQIYGTQYKIVNGISVLEPLDTTKITDAQRIWAGVQTLEQNRKYLESRNRAEKANSNK